MVGIEEKSVTYPAVLDFWAAAPRINIVNDQDFPKCQILESLGIEGSPLVENFGISDLQEIMSRQELMRYMIENPQFTNWLLNARTSSPLPGMKDYAGPEQTAKDFLEYFDLSQDHTPFWQMVHDMRGFLNSESLPRKLQKFEDVMEGGSWLENIENELGKGIGEKLQNIALIEGTMTFLVETVTSQEGKICDCRVTKLSWIEDMVHGFKKYAYSLLEAQKRSSVPRWTKDSRNPANWIGIGKLVARFARERDRWALDKAYENMVIDKASQELINDIQDGLLAVLKKFSWKSDTLVNHSRIKVFFSYSSCGLQVRVLSWKPNVSIPAEARFTASYYPGYSSELLEINKEIQIKISNEYVETFEAGKMADLAASVQRQRHDFFSRLYNFNAPNSDPIYRWYAISNLYKRYYRGSYDLLTEHRSFFFSKLEMLKEIAKLADKLSRVSKKINYPLCWPEFVTEGGHVVSFEEIMPIHLLRYMAEGERPIPINKMPEINGKIIGLTGSHEGGKTTVTLAVPVLIYLAQSGLPVFGKNVRMNPKSLIGLVFLTKGEGASSVARTLTDKIVKVLKAAAKVKPSEVVLAFDELGEGTQESSGYELGRDVLIYLQKMGVSVIFNTQITPLAQFAEKELCALCMRLTIDHEMHIGIGSGDMEGLRERTHLNEILNR